MSLYGINAYTSSSYLSSLMTGNKSSSNSSLANFTNSNKSNSSKDDVSSFLKNISKTDSNTDLQTLMQKINLVRSKGYQKSMTEEYRKIFAGEKSSSSSTKSSETVLSEAASGLSKSAAKLATGKDDLYSDEKGLLDSVKTFVSDYNSTVDALKNSESTSALRKGVSMVSSTAAYSKSLEKIGITVGKDNKLSIDEKKFSSAGADAVKSIFSGNYSLSGKTAEKASYIDRAALIQSQTFYNNQGQTKGFLENAMSNSLFSRLF